jgi:DNA polymerase-1
MTIDQNDGGGLKPPTALIIDARNALYRCVYAYKAELSRGKNRIFLPHPLLILLRQIDNWTRMYKPTSIHIVWDVPRSEVWRRMIYPSYKSRENNHYIEDISEDLRSLTGLCELFFTHMNVRQYYKKQMEADDLIYALVTVLHPERTVVISTDSDMVQIPYRYNTCILYEPRKETEVTPPAFNPVIHKALKGDKADNIVGYHGIGPKKAQKLTEDRKLLAQFLSTNDKMIYKRNLLLIDLSLCPKIMSNILYVQSKLAEQLNFDKQLILENIRTHKITGFLAEFGNLMTPFSNLK